MTKEVRGKLIVPVFDNNGNVIMSKELFDWCIDEIDNSIPIEWIEKWQHKVKKKGIVEYQTFPKLTMIMIDDWRKYNE